MDSDSSLPSMEPIEALEGSRGDVSTSPGKAKERGVAKESDDYNAVASSSNRQFRGLGAVGADDSQSQALGSLNASSPDRLGATVNLGLTNEGDEAREGGGRAEDGVLSPEPPRPKPSSLGDDKALNRRASVTMPTAAQRRHQIELENRASFHAQAKAQLAVLHSQIEASVTARKGIIPTESANVLNAQLIEWIKEIATPPPTDVIHLNQHRNQQPSTGTADDQNINHHHHRIASPIASFAGATAAAAATNVSIPNILTGLRANLFSVVSPHTSHDAGQLVTMATTFVHVCAVRCTSVILYRITKLLTPKCNIGKEHLRDVSQIQPHYSPLFSNVSDNSVNGGGGTNNDEGQSLARSTAGAAVGRNTIGSSNNNNNGLLLSSPAHNTASGAPADLPTSSQNEEEKANYKALHDAVVGLRLALQIIVDFAPYVSPATFAPNSGFTYASPATRLCIMACSDALKQHFKIASLIRSRILKLLHVTGVHQHEETRHRVTGAASLHFTAADIRRAADDIMSSQELLGRFCGDSRVPLILQELSDVMRIPLLYLLRTVSLLGGKGGLTQANTALAVHQEAIAAYRARYPQTTTSSAIPSPSNANAKSGALFGGPSPSSSILMSSSTNPSAGPSPSSVATVTGADAPLPPPPSAPQLEPHLKICNDIQSLLFQLVDGAVAAQSTSPSSNMPGSANNNTQGGGLGLGVSVGGSNPSQVFMQSADTTPTSQAQAVSFVSGGEREPVPSCTLSSSPFASFSASLGESVSTLFFRPPLHQLFIALPSHCGDEDDGKLLSLRLLQETVSIAESTELRKALSDPELRKSLISGLVSGAVSPHAAVVGSTLAVVKHVIRAAPVEAAQELCFFYSSAVIKLLEPDGSSLTVKEAVLDHIVEGIAAPAIDMPADMAYAGRTNNNNDSTLARTIVKTPTPTASVVVSVPLVLFLFYSFDLNTYLSSESSAVFEKLFASLDRMVRSPHTSERRKKDAQMVGASSTAPSNSGGNTTGSGSGLHDEFPLISKAMHAMASLLEALSACSKRPPTDLNRCTSPSAEDVKSPKSISTLVKLKNDRQKAAEEVNANPIKAIKKFFKITDETFNQHSVVTSPASAAASPSPDGSPAPAIVSVVALDKTKSLEAKDVPQCPPHLIQKVRDVVDFLMYTPSVTPAAVGEFLSDNKVFPLQCCRELLGRLELRGHPITSALCEMLGVLQLPKEGQRIERLLEFFAEMYFEANAERRKKTKPPVKIKDTTRRREEEEQQQNTPDYSEENGETAVGAAGVVSTSDTLASPSPDSLTLAVDGAENNNGNAAGRKEGPHFTSVAAVATASGDLNSANNTAGSADIPNGGVTADGDEEGSHNVVEWEVVPNAFFPYENVDATYVVTVATVMLNTDLHNPRIATKMTKKSFSGQLRGCNNNKDFPEGFGDGIFDAISRKPLSRGGTGGTGGDSSPSPSSAASPVGGVGGGQQPFTIGGGRMDMFFFSSEEHKEVLRALDRQRLVNSVREQIERASFTHHTEEVAADALIVTNAVAKELFVRLFPIAHRMFAKAVLEPSARNSEESLRAAMAVSVQRGLRHCLNCGIGFGCKKETEQTLFSLQRVGTIRPLAPQAFRCVLSSIAQSSVEAPSTPSLPSAPSLSPSSTCALGTIGLSSLSRVAWCMIFKFLTEAPKVASSVLSLTSPTASSAGVGDSLHFVATGGGVSDGTNSEFITINTTSAKSGRGGGEGSEGRGAGGSAAEAAQQLSGGGNGNDLNNNNSNVSMERLIDLAWAQIVSIVRTYEKSTNDDNTAAADHSIKALFDGFYDSVIRVKRSDGLTLGAYCAALRRLFIFYSPPAIGGVKSVGTATSSSSSAPVNVKTISAYGFEHRLSDLFVTLCAYHAVSDECLQVLMETLMSLLLESWVVAHGKPLTESTTEQRKIPCYFSVVRAVYECANNRSVILQKAQLEQDELMQDLAARAEGANEQLPASLAVTHTGETTATPSVVSTASHINIINLTASLSSGGSPSSTFLPPVSLLCPETAPRSSGSVDEASASLAPYSSDLAMSSRRIKLHATESAKAVAIELLRNPRVPRGEKASSSSAMMKMINSAAATATGLLEYEGEAWSVICRVLSQAMSEPSTVGTEVCSMASAALRTVTTMACDSSSSRYFNCPNPSLAYSILRMLCDVAYIAVMCSDTPTSRSALVQLLSIATAALNCPSANMAGGRGGGGGTPPPTPPPQPNKAHSGNTNDNNKNGYYDTCTPIIPSFSSYSAPSFGTDTSMTVAGDCLYAIVLALRSDKDLVRAESLQVFRSLLIQLHPSLVIEGVDMLCHIVNEMVLGRCGVAEHEGNSYDEEEPSFATASLEGSQNRLVSRLHVGCTKHQTNAKSSASRNDVCYCLPLYRLGFPLSSVTAAAPMMGTCVSRAGQGGDKEVSTCGGFDPSSTIKRCSRSTFLQTTLPSVLDLLVRDVLSSLPGRLVIPTATTFIMSCLVPIVCSGRSSPASRSLRTLCAKYITETITSCHKNAPDQPTAVDKLFRDVVAIVGGFVLWKANEGVVKGLIPLTASSLPFVLCGRRSRGETGKKAKTAYTTAEKENTCTEESEAKNSNNELLENGLLFVCCVSGEVSRYVEAVGSAFAVRTSTTDTNDNASILPTEPKRTSSPPLSTTPREVVGIGVSLPRSSSLTSIGSVGDEGSFAGYSPSSAADTSFSTALVATDVTPTKRVASAVGVPAIASIPPPLPPPSGGTKCKGVAIPMTDTTNPSNTPTREAVLDANLALLARLLEGYSNHQHHATSMGNNTVAAANSAKTNSLSPQPQSGTESDTYTAPLKSSYFGSDSSNGYVDFVHTYGIPLPTHSAEEFPSSLPLPPAAGALFDDVLQSVLNLCAAVGSSAAAINTNKADAAVLKRVREERTKLFSTKAPTKAEAVSAAAAAGGGGYNSNNTLVFMQSLSRGGAAIATGSGGGSVSRTVSVNGTGATTTTTTIPSQPPSSSSSAAAAGPFPLAPSQAVVQLLASSSSAYRRCLGVLLRSAAISRDWCAFKRLTLLMFMAASSTAATSTAATAMSTAYVAFSVVQPQPQSPPPLSPLLASYFTAASDVSIAEWWGLCRNVMLLFVTSDDGGGGGAFWKDCLGTFEVFEAVTSALMPSADSFMGMGQQLLSLHVAAAASCPDLNSSSTTTTAEVGCGYGIGDDHGDAIDSKDLPRKRSLLTLVTADDSSSNANAAVHKRKSDECISTTKSTAKPFATVAAAHWLSANNDKKKNSEAAAIAAAVESATLSANSLARALGRVSALREYLAVYALHEQEKVMLLSATTAPTSAATSINPHDDASAAYANIHQPTSSVSSTSAATAPPDVLAATRIATSAGGSEGHQHQMVYYSAHPTLAASGKQEDLTQQSSTNNNDGDDGEDNEKEKEKEEKGTGDNGDAFGNSFKLAVVSVGNAAAPESKVEEEKDTEEDEHTEKRTMDDDSNSNVVPDSDAVPTRTPHNGTNYNNATLPLGVPTDYDETQHNSRQHRTSEEGREVRVE